MVETRFTDRMQVLKAVVFLACLLPLLYLALQALAGELGANPIEAATRANGTWALRLLLLTLALTPLRALTGWSWPMRLRRMLGLFAFFYASLHLLSYIVLDQFFAWDEIFADILKRPYITVGMAAYLLLIPLALTSTDAMIRRMGGRRWMLLHRSVYVATLGAILHFFLLVKADLREPTIYAVIFAALMGYRAFGRRLARPPVRA